MPCCWLRSWNGTRVCVGGTRACETPFQHEDAIAPMAPKAPRSPSRIATRNLSRGSSGHGRALSVRTGGGGKTEGGGERERGG